MKLISKELEKDNAGQVTLIPEEAEDMWHTYNLLQVGDSLRASTIRKVQTESATGSVGSNRIRTTLTICVENIDFDSQACQLRVKGINIQENQHVKMGAYHTIELELNRKFTLAKKHWDSIVLERIATRDTEQTSKCKQQNITKGGKETPGEIEKWVTTIHIELVKKHVC
ncbi:protein pelota homolog [Bombina bombina]|uniref:protein pelota homolog n=1 Tax=Bombina bombina TaxID=8345 RepID=UPI00235A8F10|nr:protein pelota homolog [Bombina bombina]